MAKFKITGRFSAGNKISQKEVDGYAVENDEGLKIFVHKDDSYNYMVSEVTTGSRLTSTYKTKKEAVQQARDLIKRVGVEEIQKRISDMMKYIEENSK